MADCGPALRGARWLEIGSEPVIVKLVSRSLSVIPVSHLCTVFRAQLSVSLHEKQPC